MNSAGETVARFAQVARPIMRRFMPRSSCIGSAKTTIEAMHLLGLRAVEVPVQFVFQVPARNYARVTGFSRGERKKMQEKAKYWRDDIPVEGGWNGHLLVLVEDRWLLDPSIDQAHSDEFGVEIGPEILVIDTEGQENWNPRMEFEIHLGLYLDNGDTAKLHYHRIQKRDYLDSEAWNDEGLPLLACAIIQTMRKP